MTTIDQMTCPRCGGLFGVHGIYHSEPSDAEKEKLRFMHADLGGFNGIYCPDDLLDQAAIRALIDIASEHGGVSIIASEEGIVLSRADNVLAAGGWPEVRSKLIDLHLEQAA